MPALSDLPVEVLIDNLLPSIALEDLVRLGRTNNFFAAVCFDDTFWKRKCQEDFNFTSAETARTSGWKALYKGIHRPKLFVWGERRNGRLGSTNLPRDMGNGVPYPIEIKIPGARIVSLVAGGMSFHALDSKGNMYVWGALNGEMGGISYDGFADKYKMASVPHKLILPMPIRAVSCGRLHAVALDSASQVWTFTNWGRPYKLVSPLLDCHAPETTPVQVEAGWSFCAVLTQSGDVLVYWPSSGDISVKYEQLEAELGRNDPSSQARATEDNRIPCAVVNVTSNPFYLPSIPQLPDLSEADPSEEEVAAETKLIKIAGLDNNLIGLTNKGHVLKFYNLDNEAFYPSGRWEYLPKFCNAAEIRKNSAYRNDGSTLEPPKALRITHVTAHFHTFVAYSAGADSTILMGGSDTHPETDAEIMPSLQKRSVISVVLGDYHRGALTSTGQLLTWGQYSEGALGLGDPRKLAVGAPGGYATEQQLNRARQHFRSPPDVAEPAEVRFDHQQKNRGGKKFCFAATASGWHMGALVIDLEPERNAEDEDGTEGMPGHFPSDSDTPLPGGSGLPSTGPGDMPMYPPPVGGGMRRGFRGVRGGIFRIGYAGRGMNRGAYGPNGRGRGDGEGM
ncbi:RCC1/BLIP-II [Amylostereum chailletii]|nr:RCC1/BLIP-II [Amylostereum chailletii]